MKSIPSGYKQITLVLPEEVVERLDKICRIENRKRPGQIRYWVENHVLINASERAKRIDELQILDSRACIDSVGSPLSEEGLKAAMEKVKEQSGKPFKPVPDASEKPSNLNKALSKEQKFPKPQMVQSFMKGSK
jgi:hypothetical protein